MIDRAKPGRVDESREGQLLVYLHGVRLTPPTCKSTMWSRVPERSYILNLPKLLLGLTSNIYKSLFVAKCVPYDN